ncbi:MAG: type 1 glutamine amidotransferase domain-containing protein [Pseudomonadota bacterium]
MKKLLIFLCAFGLAAGAFALLLPSMLQLAGLHPQFDASPIDMSGKRALIITTSHDTLNAPGETTGDQTGVASSEMTAPYYEFLDAGMRVDLASIDGGEIPIDPLTLNWVIRDKADDRSLKDDLFQAKVKTSLSIDTIDVADYDIVFLAGGWGAAYDFTPSQVLTRLVEEAYSAPHKPILSGVCHGPLGFVEARDEEGKRLIAGRPMTGVTNRQIEQLGIDFTPFHPEAELRKAGALFEAETAFFDFFANHVVVDDENRFVTGQNQNSGAETAYRAMTILRAREGE